MLYRDKLFENNNSEGRESQGFYNRGNKKQENVAHDVRYFRFLPPERWDVKCNPPEKPCYHRRHYVLQVVANGKIVVARVDKFSEDVADESEKCRPWYMFWGTRWPLPAEKSPKSGRRMALLWPEEDPGSDRITNQLMFVPPSSSAGESSGQRLKKILPYYGLGSWFPLTPGREMFRDARCPVDTCTITLDKTQTADADAIVYHDRFIHPSHPRPPKQVQALKRLYSQGCTKGHDRVVSPDSSPLDPIFEFCSEAGLFLISHRLFM